MAPAGGGTKGRPEFGYSCQEFADGTWACRVVSRQTAFIFNPCGLARVLLHYWQSRMVCPVSVPSHIVSACCNALAWLGLRCSGSGGASLVTHDLSYRSGLWINQENPVR